MNLTAGIVAPAPYFSVYIESQNMVFAFGNFNDFRKTFNFDRCILVQFYLSLTQVIICAVSPYINLAVSC